MSMRILVKGIRNHLGIPTPPPRRVVSGDSVESDGRYVDASGLAKSNPSFDPKIFTRGVEALADKTIHKPRLKAELEGRIKGSKVQSMGVDPGRSRVPPDVDGGARYYVDIKADRSAGRAVDKVAMDLGRMMSGVEYVGTTSPKAGLYRVTYYVDMGRLEKKYYQDWWELTPTEQRELTLRSPR
jgi:hypothetical protein